MTDEAMILLELLAMARFESETRGTPALTWNGVSHATRDGHRKLAEAWLEGRQLRERIKQQEGDGEA